MNPKQSQLQTGGIAAAARQRQQANYDRLMAGENDCLPQAQPMRLEDEYVVNMAEAPPARVDDIEIFMPEDIAHANEIFKLYGDQLAGLRHVMMFALQVAAVNLSVHPDPVKPAKETVRQRLARRRKSAKAGRPW